MTTINKLNIKHSYCFDDVLLLPNHSNISSRKEIDLSCDLSSKPNLRSLRLKNPLISSPMDTVSGSDMAISMALNGGLGVIHRFMSEEEQLVEVEKVKRYVQYVFTEPYKINSNATLMELCNYLSNINVKTVCVIDDKNRLVGIITNRDLVASGILTDIDSNDLLKPVSEIMTHTPLVLFIDSEMDFWQNSVKYFQEALDMMKRHRIQKIPIIIENLNIFYGIITERALKYYFDNKKNATVDAEGRLACGIAVGVANVNWSHIDKLVNKGVDLLCVDVANGHNENCIKMVENLRKRYPSVVLMAGNIVTGEGLINLSKAGVDCVRIGIGNGSICSTRLQTGVGLGQFTAVTEIYETKIRDNLAVKLVCDGGSLGKIGNKMKALAAGADAVMLGRSLASCIESPGIIINRNGKRVKYFRGMASKMASMSKTGDKAVSGTAEGVDGVVEVRGSVADTIEEICGGIRSGMSYLGYRNQIELDSARKNGFISWALSTAIGLSETGIRIKTF